MYLCYYIQDYKYIAFNYITKNYELSIANNLCRLEYDSPSSPMAVALFMAVVSLLSAKRVATQFSFERYDCCLLKVGRKRCRAAITSSDVAK